MLMLQARRLGAARRASVGFASSRIIPQAGIPSPSPPPLPTTPAPAPIRLPSSRRWHSVDLKALDKKWRETWRADSHGKRRDGDGQKHQYVLPMFPYPSGTLHLGHLRVYTIADVIARYQTLKGNNVMLPMGWDAFGLPAENAALERGIAPGTWTTSNIAKMKEQLDMMNGSWDWSRELTTCDPNFYKHTQKLFLMLHERGLAYQAEAEVNYDPVDKTVLANEQVDSDGRSWRSGAKVEKRKLKQWFFRISEFREALLDDLDALAKNNAWPERVLTQQKNWLGKSEGAMIKFAIMSMGHDVGSAIEVFTTRPDTLFGVQYIALASTHPTVVKLAEADPELQAFLDTLPGLPQDSKVGYLLPQVRAINPLAYHDDTPDASKESLPVYIAPYVLGDYGEGAVMGVPGHDIRDHSFWREHHHDAPVRYVLAASEDESTTTMRNEPLVSHGYMTEHSGPYKGKSSKEAGKMIIGMLEAADLARRVEKWRLRDWLISRQRYWGTPIPIVHCDSCGAVPVPDEELPVKAPEVDNHWAEGKGGNALESSPEFVNTTCPKCNGAARRDTDTMDTFVDSSWYYTRFADPHNAEQLFSAEAGKNLPVDIYIGGIEHAILHLLYARFIYKFLATTPLLPQYGEGSAHAEPFKRLITQGMVHGKTYINPENGRILKPDEVDLKVLARPKVVATGAQATVRFEKMSKSKYNGVDPTDFIAKYGADSTRAHMLFQAPVGDVLNWDESKISGVTRWLQKLYDQVVVIAATPCGPVDEQVAEEYLKQELRKSYDEGSAEFVRREAEKQLWRQTQGYVKSATESYEAIYSLNTVVSDLMSLTNYLASAKGAGVLMRRAAAGVLIRLAAPITPAFAEECWSVLHGGQTSMFTSAAFPTQDSSLDRMRDRAVKCAVQINGKLRGVVRIQRPPLHLVHDALRDWVRDQVLDNEEGRERFGGNGPYDVSKAKRAIVVPGGTLINFVM